MRAIRWVVAMLIILTLLGERSVAALDVSEPPVEYYSPVFLTLFQTVRTTTIVDTLPITTDRLDAFELYNDTDEPVAVAGWSVVIVDQYGDICSVDLSGWVLPESYVAAVSSEAGIVDETGSVRSFETCYQSGRTITKLELRNMAGQVQDSVALTATGAFARKGLTKTYRTGIFSKDFAALSAAGRSGIYAGLWYEPLTETSLRIVELMPRSRECAPNEVAADCRDFIKLYNPLSTDVSLDGLRLRIGYQGQTSTTANTFVLGGTLSSGSYGIFTQKTDSTPLSITNDGGYVWLEDTYGIRRYDETIVAYPSAESDSKVGWGWAYDMTDTSWKWTSTVMPYGQPSVFTLPVEPEPEKVEDTRKPCAANQYRNPLTNRCKLIGSTTSSLQPCASNQYRNPTTNRCRSLTSSTSALVACTASQYRNPLTNRCRAIASTAGSSLAACGPGKERNPLTNRCRTIVRNIAADFPVEVVRPSGEAVMGWWAFGGVGILAAGYAAWEWRREMMAAIVRAVAFVTNRR